MGGVTWGHETGDQAKSQTLSSHVGMSRMCGSDFTLLGTEREAQWMSLPAVRSPAESYGSGGAWLPRGKTLRVGNPWTP